MNFEQIESFLAVVASGTISAAAESLYVSQSTVSSRIIQLENELGVQLLIRRQGHRNVELTSHGEAFIPIANQWDTLFRETRALQTEPEVRKLAIASVDAVNNYTFTGLYSRFVAACPDIRLELKTHHSNEIHALVESRAADIGFVYSSAAWPDLISEPVYRELMYLVCRRDSTYHDGITCADLDVRDEVFLNWGPDYKRWHDAHWSPYQSPFITVNTGSMLQHYLDVPQRWAIAPLSVIEAMHENRDLAYYSVANGPSPRICYKITSRYPSPTRIKAIRQFEEEMLNYIRNDSSVCIYEDWMFGSNVWKDEK
ncbi:MAG: LysR family transcriptional regulator [Solobacterium sp.]|nr:LysR family transcriptional regulator [Solobacterium sp.]